MALGRPITQLTDPIQVAIVSDESREATYIEGKLERVDTPHAPIRDLAHLPSINLEYATVQLTKQGFREGFTFPQSLGNLENHEDVSEIVWD